jgi:hypothetical protein
MNILLWVMGIHLFELLIIGLYLLINKNMKLEKVIIEQNNYLNSIDILIREMEDSLEFIKERSHIEGDEELKGAYEKLYELKSILK